MNIFKKPAPTIIEMRIKIPNVYTIPKPQWNYYKKANWKKFTKNIDDIRFRSLLEKNEIFPMFIKKLLKKTKE